MSEAIVFPGWWYGRAHAEGPGCRRSLVRGDGRYPSTHYFSSPHRRHVPVQPRNRLRRTEWPRRARHPARTSRRLSCRRAGVGARVGNQGCSPRVIGHQLVPGSDTRPAPRWRQCISGSSFQNSLTMWTSNLSWLALGALRSLRSRTRRLRSVCHRRDRSHPGRSLGWSFARWDSSGQLGTCIVMAAAPWCWRH